MRLFTHSDDIDDLTAATHEGELSDALSGWVSRIYDDAETTRERDRDLVSAMRQRRAAFIRDHVTPADAMPAQACKDRVPMRDGRLCPHCFTDHTEGRAR